jgi:hypothetical protein
MELSGSPVELYRSRSPATNYPDPIKRSQELIQWHHRCKPSAKDFKGQVNTLSDQMLYLILYGNMSDNQRANALVKLSKQLFEEQKQQEALLHRDKEIELKRQGALLKAASLQEKIQASKQRRVAEAAKLAAASGEQSE